MSTVTLNGESLTVNGDIVTISYLQAVGAQVAIAKQTIPFNEVGITAQNTTIIYEASNPILSFRPGRNLNAITGFTINKGYYIIFTQPVDLSNICILPIN